MQFHAINCILEKVIHEIPTKQKGTILKIFWDSNMDILGEKIGKTLSYSLCNERKKCKTNLLSSIFTDFFTTRSLISVPNI